MGREDLKALGSGALDNPPREGVWTQVCSTSRFLLGFFSCVFINSYTSLVSLIRRRI